MINIVINTLVALIHFFVWLLRLALGQSRKTIEVYMDNRFYAGAPDMYDSTVN